MKNIINAMDKFGDGVDDLGSFNPEEFFGGPTNDNKFSNPFQTDDTETKTTEEQPKTDEQPKPVEQPKTDEQIKADEKTNEPESDEFNIPVDDEFNIPIDDEFNLGTDTEFLVEDSSLNIDTDFMVSEDGLEERTLTGRSRLDAFEETDADDASFQITIEDTPVTVENEIPVQTPQVTNNPEPVANNVENPSEENKVISDEDFLALSKIAEVKDSNEVAKVFQPQEDKSLVFDGPVQFNVDEDEDEEPTNYNEPSLPEITKDTQQETVYSEPPINQQQSQSNAVVSNFRTYETPLGTKLRVHNTTVVKEQMLNLENFEDGKQVTGDAYIEKANVKIYQQTKKKFDFQLILANGAKVNATQFNNVPPTVTDEVAQGFIGLCVKITGKWNLYRNSQQILIDAMTQTVDTEPTDYIQPKNFDIYDEWFRTLTGSITTPWISELINRVFFADNYMEKMKGSSAALSNHDTGEGDLFRHSVKLAMIANMNAMMYPNVHTDVVVASALFHDIGKVHELTTTSYTIVGITTGHITIGHNYIRDKIVKMQEEGVSVNDNVALNLLHCILSHHGKLEYGSPVTPKTREAVVLHMADMLDAQVTNIDETLMGKGNRAFSTMFRHEVLDLNTF